MRWRTPAPPRYPTSGELRTRYVFAWTPTVVGKYTVWLERYAINERFFQPVGGGPGWWTETDRSTLVWGY